MKQSIWQVAEDEIDQDFTWISEGPWLDAEYELTLEAALAHLQLCCEAVIDDSRVELVAGYEWLECQDDPELLLHLLDNMDQDHRWYNELKELVFMLTLAGA